MTDLSLNMAIIVHSSFASISSKLCQINVPRLLDKIPFEVLQKTQSNTYILNKKEKITFGSETRQNKEITFHLLKAVFFLCLYTIYMHRKLVLSISNTVSQRSNSTHPNALKNHCVEAIKVSQIVFKISAPPLSHINFVFLK